MRLFIGAPVSKEIKNIAINLQKQILALNIPCRLVPPENLHLTLVFLDDVSINKTNRLINIINGFNKKINTIELLTKELSAFPNKNNPRVIVVEFQKNKALEKLVEKIKATLKKEGFEFDKKPFVPHLTIARTKKKQKVDFNLIKIDQKKLFINKIFLYQSFLSSKGASYQIINQG